MRREGGRRIGRWVRLGVGGALLLGAGIGLFFLPVPPPFQLREVVAVPKPTHLSEGELVKLVGVEKGAHLLTVSLSRVRRNLLKDPWIEEVTLARVYPGRLMVSLREQVPVALARTDGLYLVNRGGELFKRVEAGDPKNLPVITGLKGADRERILSLIPIVDRFQDNEAIRPLGLSEIHWDEKKGVTLYTMRPVIKVVLGTEQWESRLKKLGEILPEMGRREGRPLSVDLTYGKRIFVKTKT